MPGNPRRRRADRRGPVRWLGAGGVRSAAGDDVLAAADLDSDGRAEVLVRYDGYRRLRVHALDGTPDARCVDKGTGGFHELWRGPEMAGFHTNEIMAVNMDGSPMRDLVLNGYFSGEYQGSFLVVSDTLTDFGSLRLRLRR